MADTILPAPTPAAVAAAADEETTKLVARIHEIGPLLRENAVLADQQRFPADATVTALQEAGAFSVSALARYGGYEGGARMLFEVARAIGYHDPAAGWITVISNGSVMLANRLPDTTLTRIFGDRTPPGEARDHGTPRMASILSSPRALAVPDGDGYRISGEWPYASNVHHSEWALVMVQPPGAAAASDAPAPAGTPDSPAGKGGTPDKGGHSWQGRRAQLRAPAQGSVVDQEHLVHHRDARHRQRHPGSRGRVGPR